MGAERGIERDDAEPIVLRPPVQRGVEVSVADPCLATNARKFATAAGQRGWSVRITSAVGFDPTAPGKAIWEPTGEYTDNGTARKKRIGTEEPQAVHSLRVVVRKAEQILVGHWIDKRWDCGLSLAGRVVVANMNWSQLWKAFNAESSADVRGENHRLFWTADQLPLDGDA